jgi:hypothetical protein
MHGTCIKINKIKKYWYSSSPLKVPGIFMYSKIFQTGSGAHKNFFFAKVSGIFSAGYSPRSVNLDTDLNLQPKNEKDRSYTSVPPNPLPQCQHEVHKDCRVLDLINLNNTHQLSHSFTVASLCQLPL